MHARLIVILLLLMWDEVFPQKFLRITRVVLGRTVITDIDNHTPLKYRSRGMFFYGRAQLVDMRDSALYFSNSETVRLADLRGIRIRSTAHFPKVLQKFFFYGGFGLIPLSVTNNLITGQPVQVTRPLIVISAAALAAGGLILFLRTKRIHTGRGKVLKIMERDQDPAKPADAGDNDAR